VASRYHVEEARRCYDTLRCACIPSTLFPYDLTPATLRRRNRWLHTLGGAGLRRRGATRVTHRQIEGCLKWKLEEITRAVRLSMALLSTTPTLWPTPHVPTGTMKAIHRNESEEGRKHTFPHISVGCRRRSRSAYHYVTEINQAGWPFALCTLHSRKLPFVIVTAYALGASHHHEIETHAPRCYRMKSMKSIFSYQRRKPTIEGRRSVPATFSQSKRTPLSLQKASRGTVIDRALHDEGATCR